MAKKETYHIDLPEGGSQRRGGSERNRSNGNRNGNRRPTGAQSARSGKRPMTKSQRRRKKRKRLFIIEAVVLALLLALLFVWLNLGMIGWDDLKNLRTNQLDDETKNMLDGYTTIALFGVDNRSNGNYESGNSDCILIASINNETKEVKLVSVYRDTCLDVDGDHTFRKCNYAYNHGGPEAAIEMLNRNLDLNIQKYVAVDFYALIEVVDALGGIELDIDEDEAYYLNTYGGGYIANTARIVGVKDPGPVRVGSNVHVSGVQAVAYCRIRYTSGADFKRAMRQRIVIEKIIEKVNDASLGELYEMANSMFDDVGTNFTLSQILGLARYVKNYQLVDAKGFPFDKRSGTYGGSSLVVPCTLEDNVRTLHAYLYNNEDVKLSEEVKDISDAITRFTGLNSGDAVDYGY